MGDSATAYIAEREGLGKGRAQNGWLAVELLRFFNLKCHYGAREVFSSVSGAFNHGERVRMLEGSGRGFYDDEPYAEKTFAAPASLSDRK